MQTNNRIFDDLAKVASGAASALVGVKDEINGLIRQQVDRLVAELDLVSREELDAVEEVAANARMEQERLAERVAVLESRIEALSQPASASAPQAAPEEGGG